MFWSDCSSGKKCFISQEEAEISLLEYRSEANFRIGSGPINVYECHICEQWHFTSKGKPSHLLKENVEHFKKSGNSEARFWEDKLKRR